MKQKKDFMSTLRFDKENVKQILCKECKEWYNSVYYKSCPYCTPGIINPLKARHYDEHA